MVTISPSAAQRVRALCQERGEAGPVLRLAALEGGCAESGAGYRYDLQIGDGGDDALAFESEGVRLLVDRASYPLLAGTVVDYETSLMRSGFVLRNPNAVHTCACGKSFKTAADDGELH